MANVEVELLHDAIEDLLDEALPIVEKKANEIANRANRLKGHGVKPYEVIVKHGPSKKYRYKGGRKFAMVVANDITTKQDNARNNTLLKAMG